MYVTVRSQQLCEISRTLHSIWIWLPQKVNDMSAFDTHCEIAAPYRDLFVTMFEYATGVYDGPAHLTERTSYDILFIPPPGGYG
jgi:hypothetical protein